MVQYIQIFATIKSVSMFFFSFISKVKSILYFQWTGQVFESLPPECFLNSCLVIVGVLGVSVMVSLLVWKGLANPVNPVLIKIKSFFNFSFLIVVWKITLIPLGSGIINNFIWMSQNPPVTTLVVINDVVCTFFAICFVGAFILLIWFMLTSRIKDYHDSQIHSLAHKLYD